MRKTALARALARQPRAALPFKVRKAASYPPESEFTGWGYSLRSPIWRAQKGCHQMATENLRAYSCDVVRPQGMFSRSNLTARPAHAEFVRPMMRGVDNEFELRAVKQYNRLAKLKRWGTWAVMVEKRQLKQFLHQVKTAEIKFPDGLELALYGDRGLKDGEYYLAVHVNETRVSPRHSLPILRRLQRPVPCLEMRQKDHGKHYGIRQQCPSGLRPFPNSTPTPRHSATLAPVQTPRTSRPQLACRSSGQRGRLGLGRVPCLRFGWRSHARCETEPSCADERSQSESGRRRTGPSGIGGIPFLKTSQQSESPGDSTC